MLAQPPLDSAIRPPAFAHFPILPVGLVRQANGQLIKTALVVVTTTNA
jgi:hypothetical protein